MTAPPTPESKTSSPARSSSRHGSQESLLAVSSASTSEVDLTARVAKPVSPLARSHRSWCSEQQLMGTEDEPHGPAGALDDLTGDSQVTLPTRAQPTAHELADDITITRAQSNALVQGLSTALHSQLLASRIHTRENYFPPPMMGSAFISSALASKWRSGLRRRRVLSSC